VSYCPVYSGLIVKSEQRERFPLLPLSFFLTLVSPPSPLPFPSLPLEVGPLNPARGSGVVNSPSGVWGGAPAETEFGAF